MIAAVVLLSSAALAIRRLSCAQDCTETAVSQARALVKTAVALVLV
jgi:hypothetical protein